jgi:hypothetical protein
MFPLTGFAAFVVVAFAAGPVADLALEVELHVARGELSCGWHGASRDWVV